MSNECEKTVYLNPYVKIKNKFLVKSCLRLLLGISLLFTVSTSVAKDDNSARQKAFDLQTQGRAKFAAEQYQEAISLWRQAYDTYQDNKLLLYIASTYGKINRACVEEESAWNAYLTACKGQNCPGKDKGLVRHKQFKARCYITVKIDSPTPNASVSYQGQNWGKIPLKKDLLMTDLNNLKVSAPGYLSKMIDLKLSDPKLSTSVPTGHETKPVNQTTINVPLTLIPPESFFEKHQLKIALSTAIVGVSLLSVGSLNLSSASSIADQESQAEYPKQYASEAERQKYKEQYRSNKANFESDQLWGSVMLTVGVATLGAGIWMLLYQGPNAILHEKARRQGDLTYNINDHWLERTTWTFSPIIDQEREVSGFQGSWQLRF